MEGLAWIFRSRPDVCLLNAALLAPAEQARHQRFAQTAPPKGSAYPDPGCMCSLLIAAADDKPRDLVLIPGHHLQTGVRVRSTQCVQPGVIAFEAVVALLSEGFFVCCVNGRQLVTRNGADFQAIWKWCKMDGFGGQLTLLPPRNEPRASKDSLTVWIIRVWEEPPAQGEEPLPQGEELLEWLLLTRGPHHDA